MSFRRACTLSVTIFSIITLIVSLVFIGTDVGSANGTSCDGLYTRFNLKIGLPLLILSLIGLIGSCCRTTFFLWLYLCLLLVFLVGIFIFSTIEWSAIRNDEAGELTSDVYRPKTFSYKLQALLETNWKDYAKCMEEEKVIVDTCKFDDSYLLEPSKNEKYMIDSPFQWACCIPPLNCGYEHKNFSDWIVPKSGLVPGEKDEPDCSSWNNREDVRCLKCNKCKSLLLFSRRERIKQLVLTNLGLVLVFIVINLTTSICAFKTNKSANRYMKYRQEQVKKACDPASFPQP